MSKVQLVSKTMFFPPEDVPFMSDETGGQAVVEFGGRACYQSWNKPNPETATNKGYIANIIKQQHFSVLEHANVGFYITEVPRSLTHEFVRHRHFSYSELSQRYVNVEDYPEIAPPDILPYEGSTLWLDTEDHFNSANSLYGMWAEKLERDGKTRKEARQAARFVLPESKETRIVVTGNFRSWIEFNTKRNSKHADKAIQQTAQQIHDLLSREYPNVFANPLLEEFVNAA